MKVKGNKSGRQKQRHFSGQTDDPLKLKRVQAKKRPKYRYRWLEEDIDFTKDPTY